ncbi:MAG: hypothetical protein CMC63_08425 [Flavobacteriaceae bacterium]|nr:hypothetical protein [Flavobacteriaceae bacterium]
MIKYLFFIVSGLAVLLLLFLWSSKKSIKTGFAKDENNNQIPDAWEKRFKFIFKFEKIIILILGILMGYLFAKSDFFI